MTFIFSIKISDVELESNTRKMVAHLSGVCSYVGIEGCQGLFYSGRFILAL